MTREEIERFVRETLDTNIANAVDAIAARWEEEQDDAFAEGQYSIMSVPD